MVVVRAVQSLLAVCTVPSPSPSRSHIRVPFPSTAAGPLSLPPRVHFLSLPNGARWFAIANIGVRDRTRCAVERRVRVPFVLGQPRERDRLEYKVHIRR